MHTHIHNYQHMCTCMCMHAHVGTCTYSVVHACMRRLLSMECVEVLWWAPHTLIVLQCDLLIQVGYSYWPTIHMLSQPCGRPGYFEYMWTSPCTTTDILMPSSYMCVHESSVGPSSTINPKPRGKPSCYIPAQANLQKAEPLRRCLALRSRGGIHAYLTFTAGTQ